MGDEEEDSAIMRSRDVRTGPPRAVVVGLPILGILVALVIVGAVLWMWATARSFVVPQSAMAPAIFGGDEIHADATAYGLGLPIIGSVHDGSYPTRGDVIVFEWPKDRNYVYVMRVLAVGGDELRMHEDGTIDLRGKQLRRCAMGRWPKGRDPNGIADGRRAFVEWNDATGYVILQGSERLPEDVRGGPCVAKPCTVPPDHLFVAGDNRDASADSRFWGFVPIDHVIGRVMDVRVPEDLETYRACLASGK